MSQLVPFRKLENPVVLYHANCADGFCAAWLVHRRLPDATYIPVQYGEPVPVACKGRDVLIVDFSYPRLQLLDLQTDTRNLVVLDHHKTAETDLHGLDFCQFDMEKSGARLTKEYLSEPANWLVDFTEDRDLWRWKIPGSRAVSAAIGSYSKDFEVWDHLFLVGWQQLVHEGDAILRDHRQRIVEAIKNSWIIELDGHVVSCVNATSLISEIAEALAKDRPFAVCFFETGKERVYSLRSDSNGVDVSAIAKKFGGGGHPHAAGFKIPFSLGQDFLNVNMRKS